MLISYRELIYLKDQRRAKLGICGHQEASESAMSPP